MGAKVRGYIAGGYRKIARVRSVMSLHEMKAGYGISILFPVDEGNC